MPKYEELFLTVELNSTEPGKKFEAAMEPHKGKGWKIAGITLTSGDGYWGVIALQREVPDD